jgi:protein-L-isoaspartate(D-aspartate) O-methyltransferase
MRDTTVSVEALAGFLIALRSRGIRDLALLNAIEATPRELFLPESLAAYAYEDMSLPLACGQEAESPFALIDMLQHLDVSSKHQVLEIGSGSGWLTALIARLGGRVTGVERWRHLVETSTAALNRAGVANAEIVLGDGEGGIPAHAPYDRILISPSVNGLSSIMEAQLADKGAVIVPVRRSRGTSLMRYERRPDGMYELRLGSSQAARLVSGIAEGYDF